LVGTRSLLRRARVVIAIAMACGIAASSGACGSDYSTKDKPAGSEGGACYGNGTCDAPLTCASNICVRLDGASTSDASGDSGSDAAATDAKAIQDQFTPDAPLMTIDGATQDGGDVGIMFVTSVIYTTSNDWIGVDGADKACQDVAVVVPALKPRKWKAWVSDGAASALTRMTPGLKSMYVRPDGAPIGSPSAFLHGTNLMNAPNVTEGGGTVDCSTHGVWTGTAADGSAGTSSCQGWTTALPSQLGVYGDCGKVDGSWTARNEGTCDTSGHLYCFEQN
jgi:hypothetical protein